MRVAETKKNRKETVITHAGIALCILSLFFVYRDLYGMAFAAEELHGLTALETVSFAILLSSLVYGGLVYLFARLGYVRRNASLIPTPRDELERVYTSGSVVPSVCILIPSYKEEIQVLRQTIVSAALAEYPSRRIAVLLDDPPRGADLEMLVRARNLVQELHGRFHAAATRLRAELSDFLVRYSGSAGCDLRSETHRVADLYEQLAHWIEDLGLEFGGGFSHTDQFFLEQIILAPAAAHRSRAKEFRRSSPDLARVERE